MSKNRFGIVYTLCREDGHVSSCWSGENEVDLTIEGILDSDGALPDVDDLEVCRSDRSSISVGLVVEFRRQWPTLIDTLERLAQEDVDSRRA